MNSSLAIRLVIGATAIAVASSPVVASQRRVEVVAFGDISQGVVIDVGPARAIPRQADVLSWPPK